MSSDPREIAQRIVDAIWEKCCEPPSDGFDIDKAITETTRILAAEMPRWVPAKEGSMPAYGACVLVYGHDVDDSQKLGYVDVSTYSLYSGWGINAGGRATDCAVTHWQPLPSPPKERV